MKEESYLHVRRLLTITETRLDRDGNLGVYKGGEQQLVCRRQNGEEPAQTVGTSTLISPS